MIIVRPQNLYLLTNRPSVIQEMSRVLWNLSVQCREDNSLPLDPIRDQMNPVHVVTNTVICY
jgi:hypothetical protein